MSEYQDDPAVSAVDALTPEQAQATLDRFLGALAKKAAQAVPKTEAEPVVGTTLPLPTPGKQPALPRNMNADTAARLANERKAKVDAEAKLGRALKKRETTESNQPLPRNAAEVVKGSEKLAEAAAKAPPKLKTMAEATGVPARKDEQQAAAFKKATGDGRTALFTIKPQINDEKNPLPKQVKLSDVKAECPDALKESQPSGFNPFDIVKSRINSICQSPTCKNGGDILQRFVFGIVDNPTIPVVNASAVSFNPVYVLGRHLEASPSKFFAGYIQPSDVTLANALDYLETVIQLWSDGGEFEMKGGLGSGVRDMNKLVEASDGTRKMPPVENYHHHPKVYVNRPFDYTGQICIVIA